MDSSIEFSVRETEFADDYKMMVEWGKFWRFPMPPKEFLPDNGLSGLMVSYNNLPVCAGFLYQTNSAAAWLEWVISNPEVKSKAIREKCINLLIESLCEDAKDLGFEWIFTSVKNSNLIEKYKTAGFAVGTQGTTEMIKKL